MVRTELKIQEVATLVHANHSQMVDEIKQQQGLATVLATEFCLMT
jgi:hypothetical protein